MKIRRTELSSLSAAERAGLTRRNVLPDRDVRRNAAGIVDDVRTGGDAALAAAGRRYGGSPADGPIRVPGDLISRSLDAVDGYTLEALETARTAIEVVHSAQIPINGDVASRPGVVVSRQWKPLHRVAVYVPGGGAVYPSSLLMGAVPAQVAGVPEIVVATPSDPDGEVPAVVLAAAAMLGVSEVYAMGGAQAIAALAYGTETIAPVDKIVGPGNAWVTAAKLEVFGDVAIDLPAGPSEALVVSDGSVAPRVIAADLICQAEHGPDSPVVLVTTSPDEVPAVLTAVAELLSQLTREVTIRKALGDHGLIVTTRELDEALQFADDYAPEHLTLLTTSAADDAALVTSAGSVFVGPWAPESAGDYATGANHVLPTGGLARSHGPLGVEDFGSWRQVQYVTRSGLDGMRATIGALATAEGLTAHRLAAEVRFEPETS